MRITFQKHKVDGSHLKLSGGYKRLKLKLRHFDRLNCCYGNQLCQENHLFTPYDTVIEASIKKLSVSNIPSEYKATFKQQQK